MKDYQFKTKPREYQLKEFLEHGEDEFRGLLLDMGLGKSKIIIDTASNLYEKGKIDGLLVIAPNGVHTNWISDEIPTHMPDRIREQTHCFVYHSKNTAKKDSVYELGCNLRHKGLSVLVMSYDAMMTEKGRNAAKLFLTRRKVLYVLDESQRIKNPGAKRTKRILASAKYGKYRRILSGTPITNSPFDAYSQLKFLSDDVWSKQSIRNFSVFKSVFGEWTTMTLSTGRSFQKCTRYKNLKKLNETLQAICLRLQTEDVIDLNLPEKIYVKRYFEMTPKQARIYKELKENYIVEIDNEEINGALAIVRMLRLHQICCGYYPTAEDATELIPIDDKNPRLECLKEICEDLSTKTIIWARFTKDIDMICQMLGDNCVRYDGKVSQEDREAAIASFKSKDGPQFFISNTQVGGEGLTLTEAKTVIYYNNHFKLAERLQSEKRPHRIGQKDNVTYIDIVCEKTIDEKIVESLRMKNEISSIVTGDKLREWI